MRSLAWIGAVLLLTGGVAAQDTWTGSYAGVTLGGMGGNVTVTNDSPGVDPGPFEYDIDSFAPGVTAGYNYQIGGFVLGVEGQLGLLSPNGSGYIASSDPNHHQDLTLGRGLLADFGGRAGFTLGDLMFYAKGGLAFYTGEALQESTKPQYATTGTGGLTGGTIGAGVEYRFSPGVSLKAEYQHYAFGTAHGYQTALVEDPPTPVGYEFDNYHDVSFNTVKIGINFAF